METIELPVTEERGETLSQPEVRPVNIAEQATDIAAFELWREASCLGNVVPEASDPDGRE
jgi:hypothetical protein